MRARHAGGDPWLFAVTGVNVTVAAAYSILAVIHPERVLPAGMAASGASRLFASYAAARSMPLAVIGLGAMLGGSRPAVLLVAVLAGTIQLVDAAIGLAHHDPGKATGPFVLAMLQGAVVLRSTARARR